tara:strand:- start:1565 stop:2479 length:915 start_codon:yes stop_codon:yes gene_type:complete
MKGKINLPKGLYDAFKLGDKLSQKGYRGRFAPSPSWSLHLGNIRTALLSWLRATNFGGKWFLRIDDLDLLRNYTGSVESIKKDLSWLGLYWDGPMVFQSKRIDLYNSVLEVLEKNNLIYSCYCTRSQLNSLDKDKNEKYIFPGNCKNKKLSWISENERKPSYHFRNNRYTYNPFGDIILRRSDGLIAYNLSTVVDDLVLGINEIVRGADLKSVESSQLALIDVLNQRKFIFKHVPILVNKEGKKVSKRYIGKGLESIKSLGISSEEVIGLLAYSIGILPVFSPVTAIQLLDEINNKNLSIPFIR